MSRFRVLTAMVVLTTIGLILLTKAYGDLLNQVSANQQANTQALCAFRADILQRVDSSARFLVSHPHGIPGISASEIQVGILAEKRTVHALRALICTRK